MHGHDMRVQAILPSGLIVTEAALETTVLGVRQHVSVEVAFLGGPEGAEVTQVGFLPAMGQHVLPQVAGVGRLVRTNQAEQGRFIQRGASSFTSLCIVQDRDGLRKIGRS